MRLNSPAFIVLAALAVTACVGDDLPGPTGAEGACPLTEPTLLAAAPEFFAPERDTYYDLLAIGDDLLFSFDPLDAPERAYYKKSRCGGPPELYSPIAPGLHNTIYINTDEGPLLYAHNLDYEYFILDRLAVPGADPRRRVRGLPQARMSAYGAEPGLNSPSPATFVTFFAPVEDTDSEHRAAAGVNARPRNIYTHAGDPEVPAWHLGDSIVQHRHLDERLLLLDSDGALEWADPHSADRELLRTDVRHYDLSPDGTSLIWQAIGDGLDEPVYLRELATGVDREIASNNFSAASWLSAPAPAHGLVGSWHFTDDSAYAALLGPSGAFVAAAHLETGAPVAIPEHLYKSHSYLPVGGHVISLTLPDPEHHVEALWDLATGELREWYRGDAQHPTLLRVDGGIAEVFVHDPADPSVGSLHEVDLTTGESHEVMPKVGQSYIKGAQEYHVFDLQDPVDEPILTHYGFYPTDIIAIDIATGSERRIVDDAPGIVQFADSLVFLDLFSDEPGLRAIPIP